MEKHNFLDVIQWLDASDDTIVYRFPTFDSAITANSKLIVQEGQAAVFISEGTMSDVFGPGTYTLDTRNAPIVSFFQSIAYALEYPYKGEIYFINTKQFREKQMGYGKPIHDARCRIWTRARPRIRYLFLPCHRIPPPF